MWDYYTFSEANRRRCESKDGFGLSIQSWSLSDWMTALVGEVGEAANLVKKLNRIRDGIPGNTASGFVLRSQLIREVADVFIYLDLFARALSIDLPAAVTEVFNAKSDQIGSEIKL